MRTYFEEGKITILEKWSRVREMVWSSIRGTYQ